LLFLTLFSESEQRQLVERNIIILLVISVMAASLFPLNTMVILPSFCMQCGDEKLFFSIRIFVLLIACSSIFVKAKNLGHDIKNFIGFTTLALGYFLCCSTFSFVMLVLSSLLFVVGTIIYIKELHTHYLWQD
ncbi:MAG: hypothetical protein IJR49_00925, partial [Treponema sp.]|nr:hypothetical protein [Treponema sp.]